MSQIARRFLRLLAAGYAAALVVATHIPRLEVSLGVGTPIPADKLLHFSAYGVLGFLVGLIAAECEPKPTRWLPIAFARVASFALLDEITQPLCGRHMEAFDCVADAVGSAVGLALAAGWSATVSIFRRSAKGRSRG